MARTKHAERKGKSSPATEQEPRRDDVDDIPESDPDSEPTRTARPPGDEPEWSRDEGC